MYTPSASCPSVRMATSSDVLEHAAFPSNRLGVSRNKDRSPVRPGLALSECRRRLIDKLLALDSSSAALEALPLAVRSGPPPRRRAALRGTGNRTPPGAWWRDDLGGTDDQLQSFAQSDCFRRLSCERGSRGGILESSPPMNRLIAEHESTPETTLRRARSRRPAVQPQSSRCRPPRAPAMARRREAASTSR